jgi:hypothetical protein
MCIICCMQYDCPWGACSVISTNSLSSLSQAVLRILDVSPGSRSRYFASWIPDPGVKNHWIPDPQHWTTPPRFSCHVVSHTHVFLSLCWDVIQGKYPPAHILTCYNACCILVYIPLHLTIRNSVHSWTSEHLQQCCGAENISGTRCFYKIP